MPTHRLLILILSSLGLSSVALTGCGPIATVEGLVCIDAEEDATSCPAAEDVDLEEAFVYMSCDQEKISSISGEGTVQNISQLGDDMGCCYDAELIETTPGSDCDVGRPFREADAAVLAEVVQRGDWGGCDPGPVIDPARAAAWARSGAAEHASIAAFSKLALELLAHGAPAPLVRAVHAAGLDEIDHAERCFALAGRFGGVAVGPGPLPITQPIFASRPLADIAADAVREGCVGETTGAVLARAAADAAADPQVREALAAIAADEERHAALSWQVVAWAVRASSTREDAAVVREAVRAAFAAPVAAVDVTELAVRAQVEPALLRAAARTSLTDVVRPAARALMAA
ncbi:MAG: ferritin-like domain-containing protein [Pseudomonadota bacterium]|nr:ferritin-like domain-containing protein [Pseudomonadota bacterium]